MSTIKADGIEASTGTNTDLTLAGKGTGVPDLAAGFKVGGSAGVPTASIRDDAVTLAKLAAATDGVIITYDASGNPVHVGPGSDGDVLTSTGAGSPPAFEAAGGGGAWTFISSITASGAASVDFDDVFDTTYKVYCLVASSIVAGTAFNHLWVRTSTDGGSNWDYGASDYSWSVAGYGVGGQSGHTMLASDANLVIDAEVAWTGPGTAATANSMFELKISNPSSGTSYTSMMWQSNEHGSGNEFGVHIGGGGRKSATAIDSVQILMSSGTISGDFKLYGIADS